MRILYYKNFPLLWESSASNQLLIIAACCNLMQMPLTQSFLQKTGKPISSNMLIVLLSKLHNTFGRQYLLATPPNCNAKSLNPHSKTGHGCTATRSPLPIYLMRCLLDTGVCGVHARFTEALLRAELTCRDRANEREMQELYVAYSHLSLSGNE